MTTYTMNGHGDPTMQVQPEILMGIVGNQAAQFKRARWRLRTQQDKLRLSHDVHGYIKQLGAEIRQQMLS